MNDKYKSSEYIKERWSDLAKMSNVKKHVKETSQLIEHKVGLDKKVYGICQENNKYYIKICDKIKDNYLAEDFEYIGGVRHKPNEKFDSFEAASKRLNGKLFMLKEEFSLVDEDEKDETLLNQLDKVESEPESTEKETVTTTDTVETPEPSAETPIETSEPESTDSTEEIPTDSESETQDTETTQDDTSSEEDTQSDDEDDAYSEIQSLLGKLGNEIRKMDELSAQQTKNILNTVISNTKDGIAKLDDDEKEELEKRIKKDGKKIDESETMCEECDEKEENKVEEKWTLNEKYKKVINKIIKEEYEKIKGEYKIDSEDTVLSEIKNYIHSKIEEKYKEKNSVEPINEGLLELFGLDKIVKAGKDAIGKAAKSLSGQLSDEEKKLAYQYINSYQLNEEDEESPVENPSKLLQKIRDSFKTGSKKLITFVFLMILLKFAAPTMAKAEKQDNVKDIKKTELKMDGGDGDETVKVIKKINPYKRVVEKESNGNIKKFVDHKRGGDKVGSDVDINNKKVESDSKEIEKKFRWIGDKMKSVSDNPKEFKEAIKNIKNEFKERFKDSEVEIDGDNVEFTHKFLDNDNIAQSDYETVDGKIIKKGDKIPSNTKVKNILAGELTDAVDEVDKEVTQDWVKKGGGIQINFSKLQGDKYKEMSELIKKSPEKFKSLGNNNYIYFPDGKWVDSDQVNDFLKSNSEYSLGDPKSQETMNRALSSK